MKLEQLSTDWHRIKDTNFFLALTEYLREEMREEVKFDKNTATQLYLEAHRKSATATEEKNVVDSLCKLHGLFAPENATQVNINVDKIQQLERLPDSELLKLAGVDTRYLEPQGGTND